MTQNQLQLFRIPAVFYAGLSPLGRWFRRRVSDSFKAENLFIITAAVSIIVMMIANQVAWAFIRESVLAAPRGTAAVTFWLAQLAAVTLFITTCIIGFKEAVNITCTNSAVCIQQGKVQKIVPFNEIESAELIDGMTFHRHYALYAETQAFVNRKFNKQVLLRTNDGQAIVLGLPKTEMQAFLQTVEQGVRVPAYTEEMVLV